MKKSFLLSALIHLTITFLILSSSGNKKRDMESVYVVDLLNLPPSIEISNNITSNNIISSFKSEPAEASVVNRPGKEFSTKTATAPDRIGTAPVEKFSADDYMADIKNRLAQSGGSSTTQQTQKNSLRKQEDAYRERHSLASRIFPLNPKETTGVSLGFQETGIPAGNIIPLEYLDGIKIAIQRKWKLPRGEKNYSLTSVVSFKLHRDGTITDICLESGSGIKEFDESTMKAVRETGRLSPLPDTYRLDSLEVAVKFNIRGVE